MQGIVPTVEQLPSERFGERPHQGKNTCWALGRGHYNSPLPCLALLFYVSMLQV